MSALGFPEDPYDCAPDAPARVQSPATNCRPEGQQRGLHACPLDAAPAPGGAYSSMEPPLFPCCRITGKIKNAFSNVCLPGGLKPSIGDLQTPEPSGQAPQGPNLEEVAKGLERWIWLSDRLTIRRCMELCGAEGGKKGTAHFDF